MVQVKLDDKKSVGIGSTRNYSLFNVLDFNRDVDEYHVRKLMRSFGMMYLVNFIMINEKWEVIDGQHRLEAAKRMNLPVFYVMVNGYGIKEVQTLNTNSSNWGRKDHLKTNAELGLPNYVAMKKFMQDFPEFSMRSVESILTNTSRGVNLSGTRKGEKIIEANVKKAKSFEEGKFVIPNLKQSYEIAKKIKMFAPYYKGYIRSSFVAAMVGIFKNPKYDHDAMIKRVAKQPSALTDCGTITKYKELLEEIYNFRNQDKINFRF